MFKTYYNLTKPGIIYGNAITAAAGFFLASKGHIDLLLLLGVLIGTSLVIACGCVLNNCMDRNIDKHMSRTKKRALVTGAVPVVYAIVYGTILGILGFFVLWRYVNLLVVGIGALGLFFYLVMYGIAKRRSSWGTIVGSVSGATPPVAGYCAVTGRLDMGAVLLFLALVCWQMPHFYAIAMFRAKDYAAAGVPVLPLKKGMHRTKLHIVAYILAFLVACIALMLLGYAGYVFAVVMIGFCGWWLRLGRQGFAVPNNTAWARKMFGFSLVVLLVFSLMLSVDAYLP